MLVVFGIRSNLHCLVPGRGVGDSGRSPYPPPFTLPIRLMG